MIKHIVFDFDGTLVHSTEVLVTIYNEIAEQYGFKNIAPDEYHALMNLPIRARIKKLGVPMYRILLIRKITQEFKVRYGRYLPDIQSVDGMIEVIRRLNNQGYVLSIITSNAESNILQYLSNHQMDCFSYVMSANGLFGKHQTIKKYMKVNKITNKQLIYIGDETRDIQACKKIGVKVIAVTWGLDKQEMLKNESPDRVVEHPNELEVQIKSF